MFVCIRFLERVIDGLKIFTEEGFRLVLKIIGLREEGRI